MLIRENFTQTQYAAKLIKQDACFLCALFSRKFCLPPRVGVRAPSLLWSYLPSKTDIKTVKGTALKAANTLSHVHRKADAHRSTWQFKQKAQTGNFIRPFLLLPVAPQYSGIFLPLWEETKEAVKGEAKTEVKNRWEAGHLAPSNLKNSSVRMNHVTSLQQKSLVTLGTFFPHDPSCLGKPKYDVPQLPLLSLIVTNIYKSCMKRLHRRSNQTHTRSTQILRIL